VLGEGRRRSTHRQVHGFSLLYFSVPDAGSGMYERLIARPHQSRTHTAVRNLLAAACFMRVSW
jgi:hypothetical protein